ncbi:hypothetical protein BJV82DRAFT_667637 [Fennellomyces sp. T-0311]|nr:hypothetical protein BJV82DRAFT_667637 [Fennellomyces sp. T-0311]
MDISKVEQHKYHSEIDKRRKTDLAGSKLDGFPVELLWTIFSKLTFVERIRCSAVSKSLRLAVLSCPNLGSVLSNEGRPYKLSQILPFYKNLIHGSSVRVLELTTKCITRRSHSSATEELAQLMRLLEMWNCNSIRKATIKMFCFSEEKWFKTFLGIASTSLTHLSLTTVTIPRKMQHVFKLILAHFTNLKYLSYRSNILSMYNSLYASKSLGRVPTRPLQYIGNWDSAKLPYPILLVPHETLLPLTILNIEADTMDALGIHPMVFSHLPQLTHVRLSGNVFSGWPKDFYRTLFDCCPRITHFTYVDCVKDYTTDHWLTLLSRQQCRKREPTRGSTVTNYFKLGGISTTTSGVRRFHILSNFSGKRAKGHIMAILQLYHETMVAMHLSAPDEVIQCVISYLSFPRLQRLTGQDSPLTAAFSTGIWLQVLQQLREVQLFATLVTNDTFRKTQHI